MKKLLLLAMIATGFWSCQQGGDNSSAANAPADKPVSEAPAGREAVKNPVPEVAPADAPAATDVPVDPINDEEEGELIDNGGDPAASELGAMDGMTVSEAMEIDHFRERIGHDWGDVQKILIEANAIFEQDGSNYVVASGETKFSGHRWASILILDLGQDAVFACMYDEDNERFDQFEEEIEGISTPKPMIKWMAQWR